MTESADLKPARVLGSVVWINEAAVGFDVLQFLVLVVPGMVITVFPDVRSQSPEVNDSFVPILTPSSGYM